MIQTLFTLSLVFLILGLALVAVTGIIFFNWKIRDVYGFLTGKTKADVLASLREETDASKRYSMNTEMFTSQIAPQNYEEKVDVPVDNTQNLEDTSDFSETTSFLGGEAKNESQE